jgi:hypothetical protein
MERHGADAYQVAGANVVGHRRFTLEHSGSPCHSSHVAQLTLGRFAHDEESIHMVFIRARGS